MKKSKTAILFSIVFLIVFFADAPTDSTEKVFANSKPSVESLLEKRGKYLDNNKRNNLINILIVPGHDDDFSGAQHLGVKEVELNRELGKNLHSLLSKEAGFNAVLVSDEDGYNSLFEKYFKRERKKIKSFIRQSKRDFERKVKKEQILLLEKNFHNDAPAEMAQKLYGINRWSNKQDFDLVLHIHFNDYAGRYSDRYPVYDGFSIYIPDYQFANYDLSNEFAEKIAKRLKEVSFVSNMKQEKGGVIPDQELIAIGSNETLDAGVALVEYGYIYESQFVDATIRKAVLSDLAEQTYLGIKDFFGEEVLDKKDLGLSANLWQRNYIRTEDNLKLQKKLKDLGYYPPDKKTNRECPIGGLFGPCTKTAVINFQKSKGLPETGYVGNMTRNILNTI